jgi:hypothetical protein
MKTFSNIFYLFMLPEITVVFIMLAIWQASREIIRECAR